jgi:hypothetical protein
VLTLGVGVGQRAQRGVHALGRPARGVVKFGRKLISRRDLRAD